MSTDEGIGSSVNITPQETGVPGPVADHPPRQAAPSRQSLAGETPRSSRLRASGPHGLPVQIAYAVIDCVMVGLAGGLIFSSQLGMAHSRGNMSGVLGSLTRETYFALILAYAGLVVLSCASQDLYRTPRDRGGLEETLIVFKAVSLATAVLVLFLFAFGARSTTRIPVLALGVFTGATLSGWRYLKRRLILNRILRGIGVSRVLIVGAGRTGRALAAFLRANPSLGYELCGFLDAPSSDPRVVGGLAELQRVVGEQFIDEVFLSPPIDREIVKQFVVLARQLRLGLKVVPDLYDGLPSAGSPSCS